MFTVALLVVVAAPVGGVPGTRHVVRQVAAWELHVIMQLVTVEDCASWIFPRAEAAIPKVLTAKPIDRTANRLAHRHIDCLPSRRVAPLYRRRRAQGMRPRHGTRGFFYSCRKRYAVRM